MRLVLHHLRKDLRAMWPWLALWASVLSIYLLLPQERSFGNLVPMERYRALLVTVHWALAAALPAMLILQDPAAGTRAFWLTRPISRMGMLARKLFGLAIPFVLLPLAFQLLGLLRAGLGGRPLAAGLAEATLQVGGLSFAFAALASVSTSLGRYVLLLAICALGATFLGPTLLATGPPGVGSGGWLSLSNSREIVRMALLLLLAAAMLVHQWHTRRTSRSLAFAAVGVVALTWATVWPWDFLAQPARPLEHAAVDLEPAEAHQCLESGVDPSRINLCGRILVGDPAIGPDLEILRLDSRLVFPDGRTIAHRGLGRIGRIYSHLVTDEDSGSEPAVADTTTGVFQTLLQPATELYSEYAKVAGSLEVELVLASFAVDRLGTMPVEVGARLRAGPTSATLERVVIIEGPPMAVELDLHLRQIQLLLAPRTWSLPLDASLEHRSAGRSFRLTSGASSGSEDFLILPRPRLYSSREQQTLLIQGRNGSPGTGAPTTVDEVRDWLRDAEIVLRQRTHGDTHKVTLRLDEFRMADYALGQATLMLGTRQVRQSAP